MYDEGTKDEKPPRMKKLVYKKFNGDKNLDSIQEKESDLLMLMYPMTAFPFKNV